MSGLELFKEILNENWYGTSDEESVISINLDALVQALEFHSNTVRYAITHPTYCGFLCEAKGIDEKRLFLLKKYEDCEELKSFLCSVSKALGLDYRVSAYDLAGLMFNTNLSAMLCNTAEHYTESNDRAA